MTTDGVSNPSTPSTPSAPSDASTPFAPSDSNGDGELLLRAEHVTKYFPIRSGVLLQR